MQSSAAKIRSDHAIFPNARSHPKPCLRKVYKLSLPSRLDTLHNHLSSFFSTLHRVKLYTFVMVSVRPPLSDPADRLQSATPPPQDVIARIARQIWIDEGKPNGRANEHWALAEAYA